MNAPAQLSTSETYELLVSLLAKCPQTIEILPGDGSIWMDTDNTESAPSFFPFLFVEENLGIPQKILYRVYLHAVGIFKSARTCIPTRPTIISIQDSHDLDTSVLRSLAASSSVLLLANPSHYTALNARKHLVRMHLLDPHAELHFMASLQSSHHGAKHAELWYHRRWLLSAAHDSQLSNTAKLESCCRLRFVSQEVLQRELTLVSRACDLYPRNYFAWTHWQICMQSLLLDYLSGNDATGFVLIFRKEMAGLKEWIDHHVSDYSVIHLILTFSQIALQCGDVDLGNMVVEEDIVDHAISLVQAYPTHEALWMYAQAALSMLDSWQTEKAEQFMHRFVQPLACSQQLNTSNGDDLEKALQFAKVFLDKRED